MSHSSIFSNERGFGFFRTYEIPQINAGVTSALDLTDELNFIGYANVVLIYNQDAVTYEIIVNRDSNRSLLIPSGSASSPSVLTLSGTKFNRINIKNTDGAVNGTANLLRLTIQKERGLLEVQSGLIPLGLSPMGE